MSRIGSCAPLFVTREWPRPNAHLRTFCTVWVWCRPSHSAHCVSYFASVFLLYASLVFWSLNLDAIETNARSVRQHHSGHWEGSEYGCLNFFHHWQHSTPSVMISSVSERTDCAHGNESNDASSSLEPSTMANSGALPPACGI